MVFFGGVGHCWSLLPPLLYQAKQSAKLRQFSIHCVDYTGWMNSGDDFPDGAPVGSDASAPTQVTRRSSSAFGSPGTDSTVKRIDLNDVLIKHPGSTFVMRAAGDAMHGAGIADGDVLLVDRDVTAAHGAVVIAVVNGDLLCRRLEVTGAKPGRTPGQVRLVAADDATSPIDVGQSAELEVWGVVTTVIKSLTF